MIKRKKIDLPLLLFLAVLVAFLCWVLIYVSRLQEAKHLINQAKGLYQQGQYKEAIVYAEKALAIRRKVLGEEHPGTATTYNNLGILYRNIGNHDKAGSFLQKALAIRKRVLNKRDSQTALSYNNLGGLYHSKGNFAKAEFMYKQALAIQKAVLGEKNRDTVQTYNNLAVLYIDMGKYHKAEALFKKIPETYNDVIGENLPDIDLSYNNTGMLYYSKGDYTTGERVLQKALEISKDTHKEKNPRTALSYNNLAMLYVSIGDYEKAQPLLLKALAIYKEVVGGNRLDTARVYHNLGALCYSIGDYSNSEFFYQKTLAIKKEVLGKKHPSIATSYNNLGTLYTSIGDYAKAEPLLQKALDINRESLGNKHPSTALSYNNLATLYVSIGDYGKSDPLYRKSLDVCREVFGEKHPSTALSYNNLAGFYASIGDYAKSEPLYKNALVIFKELLGESHPSTFAIYAGLGFLCLQKGDIAQAMAIFRKQDVPAGLGRCHLAKKKYTKARKEFSRSLSWDEESAELEIIIGDCVGLGLALEGLGDYKAAKGHFQRAISIIESQRGQLSGNARGTFMGGNVGAGFSRMDAYEGMVRVIWKEKKKGYEAEAFQCCERVKSRKFLEMLATKGVRGKDAADEKIMAGDREFQRRLNTHRKLLKTLGNLGEKAPRGRLGEVRKELEQTEADYETFIKDVKLQNTELASLITVDVPAPSKVQVHLDQDTTLLEYFIGKGKTYAWLMTRDRIRMYEIPVGEKKISDMVNNLLLADVSNRPRRPEPKIILAPGDSKKTNDHDRKKNRELFLDGTKEIYQALIAPLAGDIKTGKLIVAPHGPLHKVPFGAINDGYESLIDHYAITVVPSASVIPQLTSKRKARIGSLLAMGNPQTEYFSLGFAENEVDRISRFFPAKNVYKRGKATEKRLKEEARGTGVIHLACHGEFHDRQPLQSGLLLAGGEGNDGRLQVHEIFGMDLRNASLVTLSACETALGTISTGDDMVGLSRAFIYAGTPSLIASLWEVDDESTGILMTRFYENWKDKGMNKSEALRQAQISLKAMPRYRHPYHWAAFVLIGDWM
jgi:tetratricopeptide (TPR) repeat protein